MSVKTYVLGFAFNHDKTKILLIKKNRPQVQAGYFNGIGGKIEIYDLTPLHSMVREFVEETGIQTTIDQWHEYATLESSHFHVTVFWSILDNISSYQSITDEIVYEVSLNSLFENQFQGCLSNLGWLITMALEKDVDYLTSVNVYK